MSNLSKDLILDGYWVNKKSGTIHWVSESKAISGGKKLWTQTTNLRYNRDYFFYEKKSMVDRGYGSLDNFLKNYEFICDSVDVPANYYHHVLHNQVLKDNFKYGRLSKKDFFARIFNY